MNINAMTLDGADASSASPFAVLGEFIDRVLPRDTDVVLVLIGEDESVTEIRFISEKGWFEGKSNLNSTFPSERTKLSAFASTSEIGWTMLRFLRSSAENAMFRIKSSKSRAIELWLRRLEEDKLEYFVRLLVP